MSHRTSFWTAVLAAWIAFSAVPARADDSALNQALAWLKQLPATKEQPDGFSRLTIDKLKTLTEIKLGGHIPGKGHVPLKDDDMRHLLALPMLTKVDVADSAGLTDAALVHFAKLKSLTTLHLKDVALTDEGLKHLLELKELSELGIGWTKVGDKGLLVVAQMSNLEVLRVSGLKLSDAGYQPLKKLPKLRELWVFNPNLSDKGLMNIAQIPALTKILLGPKHQVTPQGLAEFKRLAPKCELAALKN
jgi:hypothetical protein